MSELKEKNGVSFQVHVHYAQGCIVSSTLADVDADKDLPNAICNAVKIHLSKYGINGKIEQVHVDLRDI